jgi:hypothetical protein
VERLWHRPWTARWWQWAAFTLAAVASVVLLLAPTATQESVSASASSTGSAASTATSVTTEHLTLLQSQGRGVLLVLAAPLLLTVLPLLLPGHYARIAALGCLVLLGLFVLAGALSVGAFYLPALLVAAVVVVRGSPGWHTRADAVVGGAG